MLYFQFEELYVDFMHRSLKTNNNRKYFFLETCTSKLSIVWCEAGVRSCPQVTSLIDAHFVEWKIITFLSAEPELILLFLYHASHGWLVELFEYCIPQHFNWKRKQKSYFHLKISFFEFKKEIFRTVKIFTSISLLIPTRYQLGALSKREVQYVPDFVWHQKFLWSDLLVGPDHRIWSLVPFQASYYWQSEQNKKCMLLIRLKSNYSKNLKELWDCNFYHTSMIDWQKNRVSS